MTGFDFQPPSSSQSTFFRVSASSEYSPNGHEHEFEVIIDSLGRIWNSLLHPRDRFGRFIRTFSTVKFRPKGGRSNSPTFSGDVVSIDPDGSVVVRVNDVGNGMSATKVGDLARVSQDDLEVQTIKGLLDKSIAKQADRQVQNAVKTMRKYGLNDLADQAERALVIARDKKGNNDEAISIWRDVAEAVDLERGKGYLPGQSTDDVKAGDKQRVKDLDNVIKSLTTARHDIGDKQFKFATDKGKVSKNQNEVRQDAAKAVLDDAFAQGWDVVDFTNPDAPTTGKLQQPVASNARDQIYKAEVQDVAPTLRRAFAQKTRTGLTRLSGFRQARQVAPKDRFHLDKNGSEAVVGSIVNVDEGTKGGSTRPAFTGIVSRIQTDKSGKKLFYVRNFDQEAYGTKGYHDYRVTSGNVELASGDNQDERFKALANANMSAKSLLDGFSKEYVDEMARRYASGDAKKLSGGFFDTVPIDKRTRKDRNGEMLRIGDMVANEHGAVGVITYMEPNTQTMRVQFPNGQEAARRGPKNYTKLHGSTSEVFLQDDVYSAGGNYMPTREEAVTAARDIGANGVADAIEGGGDHEAIKQAMAADEAFTSKLATADSLWDERDAALDGGKEPPAALKQQLAMWDILAASSAGLFREPTEVPENAVAPSAPEPIDGVDAPQNPANPSQVVTPNGSTIQETGDGNYVVNNDITDPQTSIEDATSKAESEAPEAAAPAAGAEAPQPAPAEAEAATEQPSLADRIVASLRAAGDALDLGTSDRNKINNILGRLDQAVAEGNFAKVDKALADLSKAVNTMPAAKGSALSNMLAGANTKGVPLRQWMRDKNDAMDIFERKAVEPAEGVVEKPSNVDAADETPPDVNKTSDVATSELSKGLVEENGGLDVIVDSNGNPVEGAFFTVNPSSVESFDTSPTADDIAQYAADNPKTEDQGYIVFFDFTTATYKVGIVDQYGDQTTASEAGGANESNQFIDTSDGTVYNVSPEDSTQFTEDDRSVERVVESNADGNAVVKKTTPSQRKAFSGVKKQKAPGEIVDTLEKLANGDEVTVDSVQAVELQDFLSKQPVEDFGSKEAKGVAVRLADRVAAASGVQALRPYASNATARRRNNDLIWGLTQAAKQGKLSKEQLSDLDAMLTDVRRLATDGQFAEAAAAFKAARGIVADQGTFNKRGQASMDKVGKRIDAHAERMDAMGDLGTDGVEEPTGPEAPTAPEAPEEPALPEAPPGPAPEAEAPAPAEETGPAPAAGPGAGAGAEAGAEAASTGIDQFMAPFDLNTMTNLGLAKGGSNPITILEDADGKQWLFKTSKGGDTENLSSAMLGEVTAVRLQKAVGLRAPEIYAAQYTNPDTGKTEWGAVQERVPGTAEAFTESIAPADWAPQDLKDAMDDMVFNWMVSNHDGHYQQYIRDAEGNLIGIDKGQAFKWFGSYSTPDGVEQFNSSFNPNSKSGIRATMSMLLLGDYEDGKVRLPYEGKTDQDVPPVVDKIEALSNEEYAALVRPYAEATIAKQRAKAEEKGEPFNKTADDLIKDFVARKEYIRDDVVNALTEARETRISRGNDIPSLPTYELRGTSPTAGFEEYPDYDPYGDGTNVNTIRPGGLSQAPSGRWKEYIVGVDPDGDGYFHTVNRYLRGREPQLSTSSRKVLSDLKQKMQPFTEPVTLWRTTGMNKSYGTDSLDWLEGKIITDHGMFSMSVNGTVYSSGSTGMPTSAQKKRILKIRIHPDSGYKGLWTGDANTSEKEVIGDSSPYMFVHKVRPATAAERKKNAPMYNAGEEVELLEIEIVPPSFVMANKDLLEQPMDQGSTRPPYAPIAWDPNTPEGENGWSLNTDFGEPGTQGAPPSSAPVSKIKAAEQSIADTMTKIFSWFESTGNSYYSEPGASVGKAGQKLSALLNQIQKGDIVNGQAAANKLVDYLNKLNTATKNDPAVSELIDQIRQALPTALAEKLNATLPA